MRRNLFVFMLSMFALLSVAQGRESDFVEVLYFHGKQRCMTCMAIEKCTREVVEHDFAKELKSGKVRFRVVDISTKTGEALAKDYRVTWSSLYVNDWNKGKETRNDMTQFGFKNARKHTDEFKKGIRQKIRKLLK